MENFDDLIRELNPQLFEQPAATQDHNWQKLIQERAQPLDPFATVVKTKTPKLLEFDKHLSFTYRRYDGAHWHTELRNLNSDKTAFTPQQAQLKDLLHTVFALCKGTHTIQWYTPSTAQNQLDPTYQVFKYNEEWYCIINGCAYAASNTCAPRNKSYNETTFSTRNPCVFDLDTLNTLLNKLLEKPNVN